MYLSGEWDMLVLRKHLYTRRMIVKIACTENDRTSLFSATCGNEDSESFLCCIL